jgi:DNA-directed RNA polymerase subunit RPC12/RpoP
MTIKNGAGKRSEFEYISYRCQSCKDIITDTIPMEDYLDLNEADNDSYPDLDDDSTSKKIIFCSKCNSKKTKLIYNHSRMKCPKCNGNKFKNISIINWD